MRIDKKFGRRTTVFEKVQEPKRKYILVYEGEQTEIQYFDGVDEFKNELEINPLIELKPILRSYSQSSHGNPEKIIKYLIEFLEQNLEVGVKVTILIDFIIDFMVEEGKIDEKSVYNSKKLKEDLFDFFFSQLNYKEDSIIEDINKVIENVQQHLENSINITTNTDKIIEYIYDQQVVYDEEVDKICLIVDRDPKSFKEWQYDYVLNTCREKNFGFYISNPCFEFWLLLHSDEVFNLPKEEMKNNPKPRRRAQKRYLEIELSRIYEGYKKEKINFLNFKDDIRKAIENEKFFCEDVEGLKNQLGSNVGVLMEELLGR